MSNSLTLQWLNAAPAAQALDALGGTYEHSPWIVEATLSKRPFATLAAPQMVVPVPSRLTPNAKRPPFSG